MPNGFSVFIICLGTAALLFIVIRAVVSAVKAKRSGIVRTVYPSNPRTLIIELIAVALGIANFITSGVQAMLSREYVSDIDARGIAAIAEHRRVTEEELDIAELIKPADLSRKTTDKSNSS